MGQLPLEDVLTEGVEEAELAGTEALADPVGWEPPPETETEGVWEGLLPLPLPPDGTGVADPEGWAPAPPEGAGPDPEGWAPPPPPGAGAVWEG